MIKVNNITINYSSLPVLKNISFNVNPNEIVAIMGPSGCGKTTLFNIISGLIKPDKGCVEGIGDIISFVFQDDRLLPWRTVWENICLVNDVVDEKEIKKLIQDVGLEGFEHFRPNKLSGGMKKRCSIARAFYYKSDLLLMDEPFQGLDYFMRQEMFKMLLKVWENRKQTILFITHEIDDAFTVADRIIVFSNRPTTIIKEITLPERHLRDVETMHSLRKDILRLILK